MSDQTSLTRDKDGHPIVGTEAVTEITDIWTFERNLSTRDPAWRWSQRAAREPRSSAWRDPHPMSDVQMPTRQKRVALFVTCLVDLYRPAVGFAAMQLLEQAGCLVEMPRAQTCCGQPAYNSGDRATARDLAEGISMRSAATIMSSCRLVPAAAC